MPSQVEGHDARVVGEAGELVDPLPGVAPEAVEEDKRPPWILGGDIDDRERQGLGRVETDGPSIKLDIDLHGPPLARRL